MNAIAFHILALLASAGGTPMAGNTQLDELVTKGIAMPGDQTVRLPVPLMAEGLNAAEQAKVLMEAAPRGNVQAFMNASSNSPVSLKLGSMPAPGGLIRSVTTAFVVYGDWDVLTSNAFSKSIMKKDAAKGQDLGGTTVLKAGYLKTPELAVRGLSAKSTPDLKEFYLYTTFRLFGEVEISATRFGVATSTPTGVVVAAMVDPQVVSDKEFPNQWQPITRGAAGQIVLGQPQSYPVDPKQAKAISGAGFYTKVTRLLNPADAIFVEYHSAFYEPSAWFGAENDNRLPGELRKIIPYQVKQFRIKLAMATKKAAEDKAAGIVAKPEATADE